jgi:DHA1 family tetracycline resistance protein-like MFS transporter
LSRLNPLAQFWDVFRLPQLRSLLLGTFLWAFAYAILQGNLNFLTVDRFAWTPDQTSLLFFVGGLFAVLSQGILIKRLLPRLGEVNLTMIGIGLLTASYLLIGFATLIGNGNWMLVAIALVGLGNGLIMPALAGLLSQAVSEKEQGRVQGGNHSAQALARVVGPLWAGWVYQQIGAGAPYLSGAVSFVLAGWLVMAAVPVRNAPRSHQAAGAD